MAQGVRIVEYRLGWSPKRGQGGVWLKSNVFAKRGSTIPGAMHFSRFEVNRVVFAGALAKVLE